MRMIAEESQLVALHRSLKAKAIEECRRDRTHAAETRAMLTHRQGQRREGAAYAMRRERQHRSAAAFRRAREAQRRALRQRKAHRAEIDNDEAEAARLQHQLGGLQF